MTTIGLISHDSVLNGAPITLAELATELAAGPFPGALTLAFPAPGALNARYDFSGVEVCYFGRTLWGKKIPVGRPRIRRRLKKLVTAGKFDLVLANSLESFRAVEAAGDLGVPVIWWIHELASSYRRRREWEDMRRAARIADRLIFNSRASRGDAGELGEGLEEKFRIIYPGVRGPAPREEAGDLRRRAGIGETGSLIGCLGDICPEKGLDDLLEAFVRVSREVPGSRLALVGRTPERYTGYRARLDSRVREPDLAGRVCFPGETREPGRWLQAFDLLVHPSPRESFGRTVVEALLRDVPVAAARSQGVEEIVRDGETGVLVPAGDPEALAAAVLRILRAPEAARKLAAAGKRDAGRSFSPGRMAAEMGNEIATLLSEVK